MKINEIQNRLIEIFRDYKMWMCVYVQIKLNYYEYVHAFCILHLLYCSKLYWLLLLLISSCLYCYCFYSLWNVTCNLCFCQTCYSFAIGRKSTDKKKPTYPNYSCRNSIIYGFSLIFFLFSKTKIGQKFHLLFIHWFKEDQQKT